MIFQKVLRGISNLTEVEAKKILEDDGITCAAWRRAGGFLSQQRIREFLTERNVNWHLNHFDEIDHDHNPPEEFRLHSPFISTTAGCVERDAINGRNYAYSALVQAVQFATQNFTANGWVFYGFLNVIGRKSVPLAEFAEETRELHIWSDFQYWHHEGEVLAKVLIPPCHLEKAEFYEGPIVREHHAPIYTHHINNPYYKRPEEYSNIREVTVL